MKLDSIFKALGVETMEDINRLSSFFVVKQEANSSESGEPAAEERLIHPNEAIRAVRKFVETQQAFKAGKAILGSTTEEDAEYNGNTSLLSFY
jgi:hypothetical protein